MLDLFVDSHTPGYSTAQVSPQHYNSYIFRYSLSFIHECEGLLSHETLLVLRADRQHYGDRLVDHSSVHQAGEMLTLQKLSFAHEPSQGRGPTLT